MKLMKENYLWQLNEIKLPQNTIWGNHKVVKQVNDALVNFLVSISQYITCIELFYSHVIMLTKKLIVIISAGIN